MHKAVCKFQLLTQNLNKIMFHLRLSKDCYLDSKPRVIVKETGNGVVFIQRPRDVQYEPFNLPLTEEDIATIMTAIIEENSKFKLIAFSYDENGAVLYFNQVVPS